MPTGIGILFALFAGVPLWCWVNMDLPVAGRAADLLWGFVLCTGFFYGVGALTGYAIKRIRST